MVALEGSDQGALVLLEDHLGNEFAEALDVHDVDDVQLLCHFL